MIVTWFIYATSSIAFFTTLTLLQRVLAVDSKNPRAMAVIFNFIAGIFAALIFFATGAYKSFRLPSGYTPWLTLFIASLMYGLYERGRFYVAKMLDASVYTIVSNICLVVAFIGSLILYSEVLTARKIIGAFFIIAALLLVSYKKKIKEKRGTPIQGIILAVVIFTLLGLGWMLDKMGTIYFNADTYNILIWLVPIIFIYFPYIKFEKIKNELKIASWKIVVLAALNVVGYLLQLKALELQEATRVIPIVQTYTLFTVLFGILILKERENIFRKIIAGLIAISGVYFLV